MKKLFVLILFIIPGFPSVCLSSQTSITRFLATAQTDETLAYHREAIPFLLHSEDSTLLDEVELRVGMDKFRYEEQEFALRFKPRGWTKTRCEKKLAEARLKSEQGGYAQLLNQALKARYATVIQHLHHQTMMGLYSDLITLSQDRIEVLKQSSEMSGVGADRLSIDLLDAENELLRLIADRSESESRVHALGDEIRRRLGTPKNVTFDTKNLMTPQRIRQIMVLFHESLPESDSTQVTDARLTFELEKASYDVEESESRAWLSFVETAYDLSRKDKFEDAFTLEFGIAVPIGVARRPEIHTARLKRMKAENQYRLLKKQRENRIPVLYDELNRLLSQDEIIRKNEKTDRRRTMYALWQETEGADPLLLLDLKESILEGDIVDEKRIYRIRMIYVELLDLLGKLSEKPMLNYLDYALGKISL